VRAVHALIKALSAKTEGSCDEVGSRGASYRTPPCVLVRPFGAHRIIFSVHTPLTKPLSLRNMDVEDDGRTREQLLAENAALRRRIRALEDNMKRSGSR
jgi:hypothetical protein